MTYSPSVNRACEAMPPTDSPEYRLTPGHCPHLVEDRFRFPLRADSALVVSSEVFADDLS